MKTLLGDLRLGGQLLVVAIQGELVGDPGVIELLDDVTEILGLRLELLVLADDALGRSAVGPSSREFEKTACSSSTVTVRPFDRFLAVDARLPRRTLSTSGWHKLN